LARPKSYLKKYPQVLSTLSLANKTAFASNPRYLALLRKSDFD